MITLINNGNQTFTIRRDGIEVFTGPLAAAMLEHSRLTLAHRPAAVTSPRKARRLAQVQERKEAGL